MSTAMLEQVTMGTVEALSRLAKSKDAAAWSVLIEHYGSHVLSTTRRVTGNASLADDAAQETFLQIRDHASCFKAPKHDAERAARCWIVRVACLTALRMMRDQRRARRRDENYTKTHPATEDGAAEKLLLAAELSQRLRSELCALPERHRLPLVLHFFGGLDYSDLAAELKCPIGSAKSNVHRGLERLRNRMSYAGIVLPLSALLSECAKAPDDSAPNPQHFAQWTSLLSKSLKPAVNVMAATTGGISLMFKCLTITTVAVLVTTLSVTLPSARGAQNAEGSTPAPAASAKVAKPDEDSKVVATIAAKVLSITPESGTIMISAGDKEKVLPGYQFTISRDGKFVAKVQVDTVFNDVCAARLVPAMGNGTGKISTEDKAEMELLAWQDKMHAKLQEHIKSMDFMKADLDWVVNTMFIVTGVNMQQTKAAQEAGIAITIHAEELPLVSFLNQIQMNNDVVWWVQDHVVIIDVRKKDKAKSDESSESSSNSNDF